MIELDLLSCRLVNAGKYRGAITTFIIGAIINSFYMERAYDVALESGASEEEAFELREKAKYIGSVMCAIATAIAL